MARSSEVFRPRVFVCTGSCCDPPFFGGDACGGGYMIYGNGKSRFVVVGIVAYHLREFKARAEFFAHRHTYQSLCGACHQVDVFSCGKLGGAYHISFIFSVFIIGDQYYSAFFKVFQSFRYSVEFEHLKYLLLKSVFYKKFFCY